MGCSPSKDDITPITALCRQRRDLIRAAADRRFDFAAAHSNYFRSLDRVGEALHRFVAEELTAVSDLSSSPVLTLPPSEGKSKSKSDGSDGNFNGEFNVDGVTGDSNHHISISDSSNSISSSSSASDLSRLHLHEGNADQNFRSEPNSFRSFDAGRYSEFANPNYLLNPNDFPNQFSSYSNPNYLNPNYYSNVVNGVQYGAFQNPYFYSNVENGGQFGTYSHYNFNYMKKSGTVPSTYYVDPNVESFRYADHYSDLSESIPSSTKRVHHARKSNAIPSTYYMDRESASPGYSNHYSNDLNSMPRGEIKNRNGFGKEEQAPPPPPDPKVSGWDFLNVFDVYDQYLTEFKESFRSEMSSSSPGSSEIREKEGIPDLEEETEPESFREGLNTGVNTLKTVVLEEVDEDKVSNFVDERVAKEDEVFERKEVSFEEDDVIKKEDSCFGSSLTSSMITEESGLCTRAMLNVHGTKDVLEVVEEIKDQFKSAAGCGEEVGKLLEVGKRRYRTRRRFLKVILSRVLDSLALSLSSGEHLSPEAHCLDADASKPNVSSAHVDSINLKSKNLSDTLDKLYVWEKKLYKEIKEEENLRVAYEKECRRLKALDDVGAESSEIDSTRTTIKHLLTSKRIAIKSIAAISRKMHELRDEELRPELIDLLKGLTGMWSSILACHQKQLQAISASKPNNLTARSRTERNTTAKATKELENSLQDWSSCFQNWITAQKGYMESLNGWLTKWLVHEQEETSDGFIPFSPGRIGAPTVFIVSNDWHTATQRVSETNVLTAMHVFTDSVHQLCGAQFEERGQKLKAEYLSRDYRNRAKALGNGTGVVSLEKGDDALNVMKKRLDEEMAKHREIVRRVGEVASGGLQMGLGAVFEALTDYTAEMLRACRCVRIPRNGEGT